MEESKTPLAAFIIINCGYLLLKNRRKELRHRRWWITSLNNSRDRSSNDPLKYGVSPMPPYGNTSISNSTGRHWYFLEFQDFMTRPKWKILGGSNAARRLFQRLPVVYISTTASPQESVLNWKWSSEDQSDIPEKKEEVMTTVRASAECNRTVVS
ncbi:hypothetical protein NQ318_010609 [Aromia moschata]|uniref:Uncharacterized protein n=1 Tax=Aromia moschata TaxID=1265417 RepID=A0AAV8XL43_9CUCU|nr:hypothetical protein NQ318_010609 [Aromia moschata]